VINQIKHGLKYGVRSFIWQAGRRTGKTVLSNDILLHAMLRGGDVGIFVPTNKDGSKTFDWFSEVLGGKRSPLVKDLNKTLRKIRLHTGGTLDMWSLDVEGAGRGFKYDIINVDEGAKVKNLKSQLGESVTATITDTDGWMLVTSTPRGVGNHFNKLFEKGQVPNPTVMSFRTPTYANPYMKKETLMLRKLEREEAGERWMWEQEYLAIPATQGVNPFTAEMLAAQKQLRITNNPVVAWSIDLAKAIDFTVVMGFDKDCKIAQFYRFQADWTHIQDRIVKILARYPNAPALVDATGVGGVAYDHLKRTGANVRKIVFTYKNRPKVLREYRIALREGRAWVLDGIMMGELRNAEYEEKKHDVHIFVPTGHDDCLMAGAMGTTILNRLGYPRSLKTSKRKTITSRGGKHIKNMKRY